MLWGGKKKTIIFGHVSIEICIYQRNKMLIRIMQDCVDIL